MIINLQYIRIEWCEMLQKSWRMTKLDTEVYDAMQNNVPLRIFTTPQLLQMRCQLLALNLIGTLVRKKVSYAR